MAYTTINKSSLFFTPKLYTGNGGTNNITGVGFQPDWVWIKSRASAGEDHYLFDVLRGATNYIHSNTTAAQSSNSSTLTAFGSDGFSVGANNSVNKSSDTLVSWNWKAGTTSGIATNGSTQITPSAYSFNQTSGFSIVQYTGAGGTPKRIAHGLGVQPKMFFIKRTNSTGSWGALPQQYGTGHLYLNAPGGISNTNPLSGGALADTVNFSVSDSSDVNASGSTYIAYCFADVTGFSQMGSYIGNGSATDGPFNHTGFSPAFVMVKVVTTTDSWMMYTNKIGATTGSDTGFNIHSRLLEANGAGAEQSSGTNQGIDMFSNGFKLLEDNGNLNGSGQTYIYMAYAQNPFVTSTGIPTTGR